jgi:formate dehydrogenase beta subunit
MAEIGLKIDGYGITAEEGQRLITVARNSGFYIPGLCHHPDLRPEGHCGLCAVEIDGYSTPQLSCMIDVADGMVVRTSSELLDKIRHDKLREILANHPHGCLDCEIRFDCDKETCSYDKPVHDRCCSFFEECELRMHTDYLGVPDNIPEYKPRGLPQFTEQQIFYRNYELCIECTRCARACIFSEGRDIYRTYFTGGKLNRDAIKPLGETDCSFCGYCVDACPTGAISLLESEFGFVGYFPVGTAGRLNIPITPPSEKMPLTEIVVEEVTNNPGRINIYDLGGKLILSKHVTNIRDALSDQIDTDKHNTFTIQPDY